MTVRGSILATLHQLGLMGLWQWANRGNIPILAFHGVCDEEQYGSSRPIRWRLTVTDFRRYLDVLSKCFHFVSLADAVAMLSGRRPMQPYSIVLTFDDGYLNNATHAWALLRQFNAPATFFLPTGLIGTGEYFWADRLDYAIRHLERDLEYLAIDGVKFAVGGRDPIALARLFWLAKGACMDLGWNRADRLVREIEAQCDATLDDCPQSGHWAALMSWDDVKEMHRTGADFGSHTVHHYLLDELSPAQVMWEMTNSRERMERQLNRECWSVAYPRGQCSPSIAELAREAGYRCGLSTVERSAGAEHKVMMLPRVGLPARPLGTDDVLARACGLSQALSRMSHSLGVPLHNEPGLDEEDRAFRSEDRKGISHVE